MVVVVVAVAITFPSGLSATCSAGSCLVVAIHALAVGTVLVVLARTATIATVPAAPSVVVAVIAHTVSFPPDFGAITLDVLHTAIASSDSAIQTLTVRALVVVLVGTTAVTAVPTTGCIVVEVITVVVAFKFGFGASARHGTNTVVALRDVCAVQASAIGTEVVVIGAAAVAAVPVAPTVVVAIVTRVISFPGRMGTGARTGRAAVTSVRSRSNEAGVFTHAVLAKFVVVFRPTAVAAVPTTTTVVVPVVTVIVCFPVRV